MIINRNLLFWLQRYVIATCNSIMYYYCTGTKVPRNSNTRLISWQFSNFTLEIVLFRFRKVVSRNPEPQDSFEQSLCKTQLIILCFTQGLFKTILWLRISSFYFSKFEISKISIFEIVTRRRATGSASGHIIVLTGSNAT